METNIFYFNLQNTIWSGIKIEEVFNNNQLSMRLPFHCNSSSISTVFWMKHYTWNIFGSTKLLARTKNIQNECESEAKRMSVETFLLILLIGSAAPKPIYEDQLFNELYQETVSFVLIQASIFLSTSLSLFLFVFAKTASSDFMRIH